MIIYSTGITLFHNDMFLYYKKPTNFGHNEIGRYIHTLYHIIFIIDCKFESRLLDDKTFFIILFFKHKFIFILQIRIILFLL